MFQCVQTTCLEEHIKVSHDWYMWDAYIWLIQNFF